MTKASKIVGLVPEKVYCTYHPDNSHWNYPKGHNNKELLYCEFCETFHIHNSTLDQISAVELDVVFDMDKLARVIWEQKNIKTKYWEDDKNNFRAITFGECRTIANALIASKDSFASIKVVGGKNESKKYA